MGRTDRRNVDRKHPSAPRCKKGQPPRRHSRTPPTKMNVDGKHYINSNVFVYIYIYSYIYIWKQTSDFLLEIIRVERIRRSLGALYTSKMWDGQRQRAIGRYHLMPRPFPNGQDAFGWLGKRGPFLFFFEYALMGRVSAAFIVEMSAVTSRNITKEKVKKLTVCYVIQGHFKELR